MWRDPEEEKREQEGKERRRLFDRLDGELEEEEERKARVEGRRKKGELDYEKGVSETVVDGYSDEERTGGGAGGAGGTEEEEWLAMDVRCSFFPLPSPSARSFLTPSSLIAGPNPPRTDSQLPENALSVRLLPSLLP